MLLREFVDIRSILYLVVHHYRVSCMKKTTICERIHVRQIFYHGFLAWVVHSTSLLVLLRLCQALPCVLGWSLLTVSVPPNWPCLAFHRLDSLSIMADYPMRQPCLGICQPP